MRNTGMFLSLLMGTAAWGGVDVAVANAAGQTARETRSSESAASLTEIIVTASRRSQTLQDTAMAVNAVSQETLNNAGVTNTAALQTAVPNLQYSTSGDGSNFIYLRGVGNAVYGSSSDNSVATYIDGVYIPRNSVANQELFDVERVEVLRGPQATLYGRNATGGAVIMKTAEPTSYLTGAADLSVGNYGDRRVRGMLSGPLVGEVSGRISVVRHQSDGYNTNLVDGSSYGGQDFWAVRGSIAAPLWENATALLTANYSKENGTLGASKLIDPTSPQFLPLAFGGYGGRYSPTPRASYNNIRAKRPLEAYGATLRVTWDLGFADVVSTTSQQAYRNGPQYADLDDSDAAFLEYRGVTERVDATYQDVLLRSHPGDQRLEWMGGVTYVREKTSRDDVLQVPGGPPPITFLTRATSEDLVRGWAGYGEFDYRLTDTLKAVAGFRYSHERRSAFTKDLTFGSTLSNDKSWNDFSPKFALEYRPRDHVLVYASATKGFKSGAFDPQNPGNAVRPEKIWNYELGARTKPTDTLTLNATLFHYKMTDRQLFSGVTDPATHRVLTFLQNAGGSKADGAELEATWQAARYLRLGANASLLKARYTDGTLLADTANAITYPTPSVTTYDVGGETMEQSPKFSGSVYANLTVPLGSAGEIELYADYFRQTARYFTAFEDRTLRAGAQDLVNARVTYRPPGDGWYLAAYGRNLGDTLNEAFMSRVKPQGTLVAYSPPKTYGLEIGIKF